MVNRIKNEFDMKLLKTLLMMFLAVQLNAQRTDKPNIVLIFIDDMGWIDAGFMGSDLYETPNIDRLASEGMMFDNAYASASNCAPSRACLISGQYGPRHGVFTVNSTKRGPVEEMRLEPVPNNSRLSSNVVTIAEALKLNGYTTAQFGKWHLGYGAQDAPIMHGFDVDSSTRSVDLPFADTNDPKQVFKITQDACDFMEDNQDEPFFAYVSHHAIHQPIEARDDKLTYFNGKTGQVVHTSTSFAAMISHMDDAVGILLDKIDELEIADNTFVVFVSDNGALPVSDSGPVRGYKGMYYDGGIRVPMIVKYPPLTQAGSLSSKPVINVDFYPTFVELAGGVYDQSHIYDGESFLPLLTNNDMVRESIFWHLPGYIDNPYRDGRDPIFRTRPVSAIRKGDWKLHLFHEEWLLDGGIDDIATNNSVELYNLTTDIGESVNLANTEIQKRDELLQDLLAWIDDVDAPMPTEIVLPNTLYEIGSGPIDTIDILEGEGANVQNSMGEVSSFGSQDKISWLIDDNGIVSWDILVHEINNDPSTTLIPDSVRFDLIVANRAINSSHLVNYVIKVDGVLKATVSANATQTATSRSLGHIIIPINAETLSIETDIGHHVDYITLTKKEVILSDVDVQSDYYFLDNVGLAKRTKRNTTNDDVIFTGLNFIHDGAKWSLVEAGNGYFYIENKANNMRIRGKDKNVNNPESIHLVDNTYTGAWVQWEITTVGSDVYIDNVGQNMRLRADASNEVVFAQKSAVEDNVKWTLNASDQSVNRVLAGVEKEIRKQNFTLYPNPTQSQLDISCELNTSATVHTRLFDLLGKSIVSTVERALSSGQHHSILDLSSIKNGIYLVEATVVQDNGDRKKYIRKIIKE